MIIATPSFSKSTVRVFKLFSVHTGNKNVAFSNSSGFKAPNGLVWMVGRTVEINVRFQIPPAYCGRCLTAFLNFLQVWRESTRGSSFQANHDRLDRNRPGTDFYFRGSSYSVPDSHSHRKPICAIRSKGWFITLRRSNQLNDKLDEIVDLLVSRKANPGKDGPKIIILDN